MESGGPEYVFRFAAGQPGVSEASGYYLRRLRGFHGRVEGPSASAGRSKRTAEASDAVPHHGKSGGNGLLGTAPDSGDRYRLQPEAFKGSRMGAFS